MNQTDVVLYGASGQLGLGLSTQLSLHIISLPPSSSTQQPKHMLLGQSKSLNWRWLSMARVSHAASGIGQAAALQVHFSTDYVLDGLGYRPWRETD